MTLRLRDTLRRSVEAVVLPDGPVRMYTCGPTVYRYAHVGNLRSYLLADLIRRSVRYHGREVFHVKNITDVGHLRDERFDRGEDRMLVQAGLEDRSPAEIAQAYEAAFHADEALVNILPAHVFPRATEHIDDMVRFIERLEDAGYAYRSDSGNVYFAVSRSQGYGRLSGNSLDDLRAGHRGDVEPDKRDPADFALWKAAGEGRLLKWPTDRYGEGFPGWHIECSAMSLRYLGERFEIHTGGIDNVFPHHEDEIAQSAALTGTVPAAHWVHGEFLQMAGRKMAKSAGNFQRITELADAGIDPLAFRYLCLTVRYGRKLDYSAASIRAAAAGLESLRASVAALGPVAPGTPWEPDPPIVAGRAPDRPTGIADAPTGHGDGIAPALRDRAALPGLPFSRTGSEHHRRFVAAIDDDLDMPSALATVRHTLRAGLDPDEARWLVLDADQILGLDLHRSLQAGPADELPGSVRARLERRAVLRAAGDFVAADAIREDLAAEGWSLEDGSEGTSTARRDRIGGDPD
ncbi:MAG TPA: cysteine--tRNA ligase [Candidatus Limnocylindrales bacterium]|nr:cysteine--tRNA ligase [Candidatus Limnocylindrales bacterium]